MTGSEKKNPMESSKSLSAQSAPQTKSPEHKNTYDLEKLHPNQILPSYRPPNTPHSEGPVQCSFDAKAHRLKRKKKED